MGQVVDADTAQPIAGAIVRLAMRTGAAAPAARGAAAPPQQLVELSDSEGRFLFHDLPKGTAVLSATAPGFMVPSGPGGRGGGGNRPVQFAEGERLFDQKIRLVRFATISGTVVDEAGEPAVGFPIQAIKRQAPGASTAPKLADSVAAITDDPPAEVAAAGHDRCIIPIKPENIDAWLNPDPKNLAALYAILDDRERPYYEHRLAA